MNKIGKKILSLINSSSRNKTHRGALLPFGEAKSIGILYTWKNAKKEETIEAFKKDLQEDKSVHILCYNDDKKNFVETKNPLTSVTDLSLLGKINSESAQEFLKKELDYLFHLDFETNEIIETLLINSKAKCRVGLHSDKGEELYELMIGINESAGLENLIEQMLKYVNALK